MGFIYIVVNKLKIPPAVIVCVRRRSTPRWPMPVLSTRKDRRSILWYSRLILLAGLTIRNHQGKYTIDHSVYPKVQHKLYEFVITYLFGQIKHHFRSTLYIQSQLISLSYSLDYTNGYPTYPSVYSYTKQFMSYTNGQLTGLFVQLTYPSPILDPDFKPVQRRKRFSGRVTNQQSSPPICLLFTLYLSPICSSFVLVFTNWSKEQTQNKP